METLKKVWNMLKVNNENTKMTSNDDVIDVLLFFLLLSLTIFHTFF